jgi:uncharacterized protein (TIGR02246 family)
MLGRAAQHAHLRDPDCKAVFLVADSPAVVSMPEAAHRYAGALVNDAESKILMLAKLGLVCAMLALAPANAQDLKQRTSDAVADAMPTIRLANSEWVTAMRSGDADAIAKPYALDAVFVTPNGDCIRGRTPIRDFYRSRLSGKSSIVSATLEQQGTVGADQGLVFEWGVGVVTSRSTEGTLATRRSTYLSVWRREEDGRWEILRNVVL